ncbi:hypothetical protein K9U39_19010 [Rhodoblastus acidophilus]|uniref:Uncharacterized protein n=1 Tax=Candidatus Rhodoblastus alkanivorans TaxID=2954117 RepID=A0ABS9Z2V9_9HYPH|nr:hypothetical protein [Candidatus Rhodoblastus alkanivorans]MCI4680455.1 hypothetical protein [Candidatus Rhodoblastus alkanivorans]MCI4681948.1 hypothetical protein [Candidatus Rhodoblastus alkanivorans]MDI4642998.1 hypothetical protein [Rhodoblastus acidophilus]
MRIGSSKELQNETLTSLGKISAASDWRGAGDAGDANVFKLKALRQLMRAAEDYDADALLDVDYTEETLARAEHPGAAPLKRVCATAVAVKLKSA